MSHTITLRHLRHFRVVAEELNLHRAAERLHTDQSALSRTIRELEAKLSVQLFARSPRAMRITPAGRCLVEQTHMLLASLESAVRAVREADGKSSLPLRIGLERGLVQPLLSQRLAQWRSLIPRTELEIIEIDPTGLSAGVRREEVDLAISFGVLEEDGLEQIPLWSYPMVVVVQPVHPLASCRDVTLPQLTGNPVVAYDNRWQPGLHRQTEVLFRRHGHLSEIGDHAQSLAGLITKVGVGLGVGLADEGHMSTVSRPDVACVPLRDRDAALTTFALRKSASAGSHPVLDQFIGYLAGEAA